jgi:hypothetical protein
MEEHFLAKVNLPDIAPVNYGEAEPKSYLNTGSRFWNMNPVQSYLASAAATGLTYLLPSAMLSILV